MPIPYEDGDIVTRFNIAEAELRVIGQINFCVCRHEILPPKRKGFLPSCRNDNCKTKWWNR